MQEKANEHWQDGLTSKSRSSPRLTVQGKFLYLGSEKFSVQGVTYGTFKPDADGYAIPSRDRVLADFRQMSAAGVNAIRLYTAPPIWFLDLARQYNLLVMVGIPWEQHIDFLDEPDVAASILRRAGDIAQSCSGHPALMCYAIGNEISSDIVRWVGQHRVEAFLYQIYRELKRVDPSVLVTYANYPTTEYLDLPFLDFLCFNVYLEEQSELEAYLSRLQILAGDKPLLLGEVGMDSNGLGKEKQAWLLRQQIISARRSASCGQFVFSWTDEWYTGGRDVNDWAFGLTTTTRGRKPAFKAVSELYLQRNRHQALERPVVTIAICSFNGAKTIRKSLLAAKQLNYPAYEILVVDDGSTDQTAEIASEFECKLIRTENRGLSNARNTAYQNASGEIVVYLDDDAYPDVDWLGYIVDAFDNPSVSIVGGPNLLPPEDNLVAHCVDRAPGCPMEVLLSDRYAEHVPGCNLAVRRSVLESVGGFDPQFRAAGDDVDFCWRVLDSGGKIRFHPGAMNWHHRRNTLKTYLKQQTGYGIAEGLLARKWPEKYNSLNHIDWQGSIYGPVRTLNDLLQRDRVYTGVWGSAPFQRLYAGEKQATRFISPLLVLIGLPEVVLLLATLAIVSTLSFFSSGFSFAVGLFMIVLLAYVGNALVGVSKSGLRTPDNAIESRIRGYAILTLMYLLQPIYRLKGRLSVGLAPVKIQRVGLRFRDLLTFPGPSDQSQHEQGQFWVREYLEKSDALTALVNHLTETKAEFDIGGDFDQWDIRLRAIFQGSAELRLLIENHGSDSYRVRYKCEKRYSKALIFHSVALSFVAVAALLSSSILISIVCLGWMFCILASSFLHARLACRKLTEALLYVFDDPQVDPVA